MATTKKSLTARVVAGIGAVAIATLTTLGGALPASAADSNVDMAALGSITVHTLAEPATASGLPNDGTVVDTSRLGTLSGVEFTVERVTGIDLSTAAGWAAADALTPATAGPLEHVDTVTTDGDGIAVFDQLPVAVYLVTETAPGANQIAIETAPFLVTVPLPQGGDWLYDVHVYPKNSLTEISKVADDSAAFGLGDDVSWTITAAVPEVPAGGALPSFVIADSLDSRLGHVTTTVTGTNVMLAYEDYVARAVGQDVTVTFTTAGLQKLAAADGASIIVDVVTSVDELGDGIIENGATVTIGDAVFTAAADSTQWGTIAILKHETGDETAVLAGAQFQVFASQADALALTDPIVVDGGATFTSNDAGIAFVPGLRAGVEYWIVETVAPAGYRVSPTAIPAYTVAAGDVSATSIDVRVANSQVEGYMLPVTGGAGQAAFMIGGFGLLAGAMGFALLRRRKAQQDA
jgi:fimbrial isopeptide formation D2 family protein/LPXTG-motif cell wall-anchored protein